MKDKKVYGEKVKIPEFKIFSCPSVNISQVKQRRFNIIDRLYKKYVMCA